MSNFPDFSQHGYQIINQLGENHLGGRVTYLAERQTDKVVIKQFQFAQMGATWAEYDAYSQEIAMLRQLNHPGIAKYLDSFQTADGFCMVQEYLDAESLATPRSWTPKQIKQIAVAVLEILVYLQSQKPSVIHRDIKPENILVDSQMQVYLVDFGFARMGGGEIGASSVVKGTMGFMPPEQLFNRQLTTASDLYGLGGTLICLLTGTKSVDIGNLIDADYRINFRHLVPPVKRGLINWLEKLTEPRLPQRYASAASALAELKTIDVDRLPKVRFSHQTLEITATEFGKPVSKTITVSNPIPDTVLSGRFSVAPHDSDPPHTPYDHAWIFFHPQQFSGNEVECEVTVDTAKLLAGETYTRQVVLHSNSSSDSDSFTVQLNTAPVPTQKKPPYKLLLIIFVATFFGGFCLALDPRFLILIPGLIPFVATLDTASRSKAQGFRVDFNKSFSWAVILQIFTLVILSLTGGLDLLWLTILSISCWLGALMGVNNSTEKKNSKKKIELFYYLTFILISSYILFINSHVLSGFLSSFIHLNTFLIFFKIWLGCIFMVILIATRRKSMNFIRSWNCWQRFKGFKFKTHHPINPPNFILGSFTAGLGISLGAGFLMCLNIIAESWKLPHQIIILLFNFSLIPVLLTGLGLGYHLSQQRKAARKIAKYRQDESTLIKP